MRISAISLTTIAATLAIIAGGTIAAPAPGAVEQVDSFEPVDIYSRWWWEGKHDRAASALKRAIHANSEAVRYADDALQVVHDRPVFANYWQGTSDHHGDEVSRLLEKYHLHMEAARRITDKTSPLYKSADKDRRAARKSKATAKGSIREAKYELSLRQR